MKPTNVIDMKRTGDLGGDKIAMKFDENSIAHIMSVLTDLYSDSELAVLREYSTNAWDSHVDAGVTRPIEVTTPNAMFPYFRVKDYGLGMSVEDVENIYSKYGASTKRETNTQTGMLGLGCKSALTYASEFTVTAIKDGIKAVVVVSRVEDGTGVMEVISTTPTDEGNGVEVSVPVKAGNTFHGKAKQFFQFWENGRVILNGEPVEQIKGKSVCPNIITIEGGGEDLIVMGNVAYPSEKLWEGYRSYGRPFRVVAFVDIGEVTFTPSREALQSNKVTKDTVARLKNEFKTALYQAVRDDIEGAPDHPEALRRFVEWSAMLYSSMPKVTHYKGQEIRTHFDVPMTRDPKTDILSGMFTMGRHGSSRLRGMSSVDHETLAKGLIITHYNGVKTTLRHRKKIEQWLMSKGQSYNHYLIFSDGVAIPGAPWVVNNNTVSWATICAEKLPTAPRTASTPVFDTYTDGDYNGNVTADDIDANAPVYYVSPRNKINGGTLKGLTEFMDGGTIVVLGENRWDKLKRQFPKARQLQSFMPEKIKELTDALTPHDRQVLGMDYHAKHLLSSLDATMVEDPDIQDAILIAQGSVTSPEVDAWSKFKPLAGHMGMRMESISAPSPLKGKYPLLEDEYSVKSVEHAHIYLNTIYSMNKDGV